MKILWTKAAAEDLDKIEVYIFKDNPGSAVNQVLRIINAVEHYLSANPGMGRWGRLPKTREFVISGTPFIVIYRIKNNILEIIRVLHGAQQWPGKH